MAKVTGPLYSMTASGKIADAMVFFTWKGQAVVRQWMIPKNLKSPDQGDRRVLLGASGMASGIVKSGSQFELDMIAGNKIAPDQTRQSALVKRILGAYLTDAVAAMALYDVYAIHTALADFEAAGIAAGLIAMECLYKGMAHSISAGMMVYILAKTGIDYGFTGAPYVTPLASWTSSEIDELMVLIAPIV